MTARSRTTYEWRQEQNGQFRLYEVTTTETPLGGPLGIPTFFNYNDLFGNILIKPEPPILSYLEQLEAQQRAREKRPIEYIVTPSYLQELLDLAHIDHSNDPFDRLDQGQSEMSMNSDIFEERDYRDLFAKNNRESSKWTSLGILDLFEQSRKEDEARMREAREESQRTWERMEAERQEREEERRWFLKPIEDESNNLNKYLIIIEDIDKWNR